MQADPKGNHEKIPQPPPIPQSPPIPRPPTIIDGLMQPGFPAKVFTCFFFSDCAVFAKTGSFSTNSEGLMRAYFGGYSSDALFFGAFAGLADYHNQQKRLKNAAGVVSWDARTMVAAHKRNFMLPYNAIRAVELKGPNFAGEIKVIISAEKNHKFRLDKQSKSTLAYYEKIFNEFLPGKVKKK